MREKRDLERREKALKQELSLWNTEKNQKDTEMLLGFARA